MQTPGTMPDGRQIHFPGAMPRPGDRRPTSLIPQGVPPPAPPQPGAASNALKTPVAPAGNTASALPPSLPPSLQDKPAQPARVTLSGGTLAVDANNSSLSKILDDLASSSGMTVDGLGAQDQRVFGVYGPGNPRDVLSSLLDGAGYNFLMVGTTETGTPREVVLTARSNAPLSATPNSGPSTPEPEDEEPPPINNPAEDANPPARPPSTMPNGQPRSPAEMLQEMQRIRQQQQQPQQQPQSPQ